MTEKKEANLQYNFKLSKTDKSKIKSHHPKVIWFTGLSGAGKSSLANLLEVKLHQVGTHTYILDGDNMRQGICKDLGFSEQDRTENIRRVAHTAQLFYDAGLVVLCCFISPFKKDRNFARSLVKEGDFLEVYVNTKLSTCEARDPKNLYKKARSGEIENFTGIDSAYEIPENAEIIINTDEYSIEECINTLFEEIYPQLRK